MNVKRPRRRLPHFGCRTILPCSSRQRREVNDAVARIGGITRMSVMRARVAPGSLAFMATWRDGAAYAPIERPDGFAAPLAPDLSTAAPRDVGTPGDVPPPETVAPPEGAAPLETVAVRPRTTRNPRDAFSVASALLTEASSSRDPRQPFATTAPRPTGDDQLPPPSGPPLAPPSGSTPLASSPTAPIPPQNWPAPTPIPGGGTLTDSAQPSPDDLPPHWKHVAPQPPPPPPSLTTAQRTIAGVALFLFIAGFLITATTAVTMVVAGVLLLRLPARLAGLGRTALSVGAAMIAWGLLTDTLARGNVLLSLASFAMAVFTVIYMARPSGQPRA